MTPIVIVGSSGHAKVVIDIVECQGTYRIVGLIDRFRDVGATTAGYEVLGGEADLPRLSERHGLQGFIVAIGDNFVRGQVTDAVQALLPGVHLVSAVHPNAVLARSVVLGAGSVVMAGAVVGPSCVVGRGCIINTHASFDHDGVLEDFVSLAPGTVIGGNCHIGSHAAVGIGATLAHNVRVGTHTLIGAGATALRSVGDHCVAFGTPATVARARVAGEPYL